MLSANAVVSSDRLIEELWGDTSPGSGRAALQVRVSQLRKVLAGRQLVTSRQGYVLQVEPGQLDLYRFQMLVGEAEGADPAVAAALLREALALWRGEPLADLTYEPFVRAAIERLRELRARALESRIDAELELGRHGQLIAEIGALIHESPLRERMHVQLMLALYRSGRQADALEAFQRARALLGGQLGLEPGPELAALQSRILTHDPSLQLPARPRERSWPHQARDGSSSLGSDRRPRRCASAMRSHTTGWRLSR
jgi:DNA-binding SARP family transcriptional activator